MTQNGKMLAAYGYKLLKQYIYAACGKENKAFLDAEVIPYFIAVLEREDYYGIVSIACHGSRTIVLLPEKEAEIKARYANQIVKCYEHHCLRNGGDLTPSYKPEFKNVIWECAYYIVRIIDAAYF